LSESGTSFIGLFLNKQIFHYDNEMTAVERFVAAVSSCISSDDESFNCVLSISDG